MRLGHGIVQTPPAFNHPARIAERIAMLDLVSNGRVDFGTGESSSEAELGGFRSTPTTSAPCGRRDFGSRCVASPRSHSPDTQARRHHAAPQRHTRSRVRSRTRRFGSACSRRDTIHLAAQHGIGALAFAFVDPEEAKYWADDYYETLAQRLRPHRRRGERQSRVCHRHSCVTKTRTKLSAGASKARTSSATRSRTTTCSVAIARPAPACGKSSRRVGPSKDSTPRRCSRGRELGPARRQGRGAGRRRPARRGRHARPDPRLPPRATRRVASTRSSSAPRPARTATSTSWRALELFGREVLPEFAERDDKLQRDKGDTTRAGHRRGLGTQARRRPPAVTDRRLRLPGDAARDGRPGRQRRFPKMLDDFAKQSALGPGGIEGLFGNR